MLAAFGFEGGQGAAVVSHPVPALPMAPNTEVAVVCLPNCYMKGTQRCFFHKVLVLGEAALTADLITAWKPIWGGCASS